MFFDLIFFVIFTVIISMAVVGAGLSGKTVRKTYGTKSSDGHYVPKSQDMTCRKYGHRHETESTPRYIVHEDPETGYVILNGIKRKISDCKNL